MSSPIDEVEDVTREVEGVTREVQDFIKEVEDVTKEDKDVPDKDVTQDIIPALPVAKAFNPALLYAPQWARDQEQPPADDRPSPPIEWPPRGRRLENIRIFGDERAALEARRELALQPEKVPEPPVPDPNDQIVGKTVLWLCGMTGAAAVIAWTLVSTLDAGLARHEPARASAAARPVATAPVQPDSPPTAIAARLGGPSRGPNGDEMLREQRQDPVQEPLQEPRQEAIAGVPAALATSTAAAEATPAIALDPPKAIALDPPKSGSTSPSLITRQMDRDELAFLVRRGESFISSGDIAAARLMLQRAAEAGDVHAALALASTYDPNTIQKLGIQGLAADEAMARLWYERAAQFGSPEAPQRLQQLANQTSTLP
jgi:hypothetical protein